MISPSGVSRAVIALDPRADPHTTAMLVLDLDEHGLRLVGTARRVGEHHIDEPHDDQRTYAGASYHRHLDHPIRRRSRSDMQASAMEMEGVSDNLKRWTATGVVIGAVGAVGALVARRNRTAPESNGASIDGPSEPAERNEPDLPRSNNGLPSENEPSAGHP
jgi:hypothetical protein